MRIFEMQPLPDPVEPSLQNIDKVKANLANLQRFNDLLYTYSITKCDNAFLLLSHNDDTDPGMNIGINLLCGSIIGIGGEFGILGCVFANYYCGIIGEFSVTKPPSLLAQYSNYVSRIQATSIQADAVMAKDYSDPTANWYTVKCGNFNGPWGEQAVSCCLGQLAAIDFPPETDPLFEQLMAKAIFGFDQTLWWTLLNANFQINGWNTGFMLPLIFPAANVPGGDAAMDKGVDNYLRSEPAYWCYYYYVQSYDKKGRDTSTYTVYTYSLGSQPIGNNDGSISDNAANYLFIDTIPGVIVNPLGLFNRAFVFNNFGLKKIEQVGASKFSITKKLNIGWLW